MFRDLKPSPILNQLLALLLCTDVLLIIFHVLRWETSFFNSTRFAIWREGGIGELFQYQKEFWLGLVFLYVGLKRINPMFIMWSLIFFYLLADDSLKWHETMGLIVANVTGLPSIFGLEPQIQGQVVYAAGIGLIFFSVIAALSWLRGRDAVNFSLRMFALLGLFAAFAVVLDWVYHLTQGKTVHHYMATLEEGGEMLVLSVIVWFVLNSLQRELRPN